MGDLEALSHHIQDRISSILLLVDMSTEISQVQMKKLGQEIVKLERCLVEFEKCVLGLKEQQKQLMEFGASFQKYLEVVQHMKENTPPHMPRRKALANGSEDVVKQTEAVDVQPAQVENENVKKPSKGTVREIVVITVPEFESIPQYMKGRVTYDQLNAAVQAINTAVKAKYKILHQPLKTLNNHSRKLHQRFKEQETKDTKGQYFVVEDDLREFTQLKVDKRFQGMLNMLRHCQRLRELRGKGLTRLMLL